jgi:hypothetical protein
MPSDGQTLPDLVAGLGGESELLEITAIVALDGGGVVAVGCSTRTRAGASLRARSPQPVHA